jgi:hypothetical protein
MAYTEINTFFTRGGLPATNIYDLNPHYDGKTYPRLRIWEINGTVFDLVVGDVHGSSQPTDGIMSPVVDSSEKDGFYSFLFTTAIGFDKAKKYLVRVDGGSSLPPGERYQVASIDPVGATAITSGDIANIVDAVWDEPMSTHLQTGTSGAYANEVHADVQQVRIDLTSALSLVRTLMKYEQNRTKIDKNAKTLTIYDDDGVTPLKVFDLKDSTGSPSVTEVCERR